MSRVYRGLSSLACFQLNPRNTRALSTTEEYTICTQVDHKQGFEKFPVIRCDVRCPQGSYGEGCLRQCRCRTPGKCNHVTGQCRETSPSTTEEVTSQVAAYRVSNDEGPALTTTLRSGETSEMPPVTSPERGSDVEGKTSEKTYMLPETSEGAHSTSPGRSSDEEGKAPKTTYKFPETPEAPLSTSSVRGSDNEGKAPETRYKLLETTEIPPTTWPARSRDVEGKTHRSPETSEVPPSIATNSDGDDLVKLPPTTEEHLTSEGSLFIHDEPVTVTTTLTTSAPNTSHLRNEGSFGTKLHSFAPAGYDPANSRQSEDFVRLPEKVPDNTDERPEGHTTVQYVNNFLADEESLQSHDKPPSGEEHPDTNPRKKDPDPAEEDVILSGDDAAAGLPPPSNDLQHLRQVKAMDPEAGADAPSSGGGLLGRDLLSTSCVSAGVAVALIVTAALIVAAAHWRKSGGKKTSPEDSKPAAMAIFAYDESRADNVFSGQYHSPAAFRYRPFTVM
ncbi:hypothetical protein PR048_007741 [Dryococelus australis]|uniref:Uncharacterized protein n=1 Tax=Dryococelus australis TaxID=614101 RepID=A0ABQ9HV38_9NEOP|nr:hypothetical protein PR048_007741 [Dryococelus australis]